MENDTFDIRNFASQVAEVLNDLAPVDSDIMTTQWTVKPKTQIEIEDGHTYWTEINNSVTGARISLSRVWNKKTHVQASGSYNNRDANGQSFWELPYNVSNPSIKCSISKGASKVANDITKRLFPEYLPLLNSCKTAWEANGKAVSSLHGVSGQLAKDLDGRVSYEQYKAKISLYHSAAFKDDSVVDITVSQYPGYDAASVRVDRLDLTPDECVSVFNLLINMRRGKI